ncbi:MAG: undecaprenyldiphospho-muramoylpentapeptide beta-N-acetylglucosaminyltransferase [Candidatus Brocadiaceae bacterium]|nr:undecaprenyldiphospho-muramoylpentapeptide beta-N-acetylglucosaminyltransferase [Candidatus Brocadiaceae bacterium]
MKIIFAGGGTGGHIIAGLNIAEEIKSRFQSAEIIFFGTNKEFEKRCVERKGFHFRKMKARKWEKSLKGMFTFICVTFTSFLVSLLAIRRYSPDMVVGLGGYASVAPMIAAKVLDIPCVLLEQNVIPGKTNRFLARWVDEVYCHWRASFKWFPKAKVVRLTGTPVRKDIFKNAKSLSGNTFGLSSSKKTILIMGGSQGAHAINEVIARSLPKLESLSGELQMIHCTGEHDFQHIQAEYKQTNIQAFVSVFLNDMGLALNMADLVICRAGAMTIAEITAIGIPVVLIPYPYATDNHQYWNAMEIEKNGGGYLLQQIDLTPDKIIETIMDVFINKERYERMRMFNRSIGIPNAAASVVDNMCRVIGVKDTQCIVSVG